MFAKLVLIAIIGTLITLFRQHEFPAVFCDEQHSTGDSLNSQHEKQIQNPDFIKHELKELLKRKVDLDNDGHVSYEELKKYLALLNEQNIEHNVNKQWVLYNPQMHEVFSWEGYEPEKTEVLTWDHYFNQTYPDLIGLDVGVPIHREQDTASILGEPVEVDKVQKEKSTPEQEAEPVESEEETNLKLLKQMVRRADARWKLADENGDTLLTKDEFKFLLHPDEGNEELQKLFVKEATEDMDLDKDEKISLDEFMKHLQVLASDQERNDHGWMMSQQENFGRFLDKNKDGLLEGDEIKNWLVPSKRVKFEVEAKRLLDIGDSNEDHKLSIAELMDQYEQFVSLLPIEFWNSPNEADDGINRDSSYASKHDEL